MPPPAKRVASSSSVAESSARSMAAIAAARGSSGCAAATTPTIRNAESAGRSAVPRCATSASGFQSAANGTSSGSRVLCTVARTSASTRSNVQSSVNAARSTAEDGEAARTVRTSIGISGDGDVPNTARSDTAEPTPAPAVRPYSPSAVEAMANDSACMYGVRADDESPPDTRPATKSHRMRRRLRRDVDDEAAPERAMVPQRSAARQANGNDVPRSGSVRRLRSCAASSSWWPEIMATSACDTRPVFCSPRWQRSASAR
mmetsp:Transcript_3922/g.14579  ORF Transcript_3922/g.14579 Transcript_3922/m.14579 type:complete len:260 (+) Transcript_3922:1368-2147(+)